MEQGLGWRFFAGTILGIAGVMRIFDGIWAFHYHHAIPENFQGALFGDDLKTYGWIYLIVGILLIAASILVVVPLGISSQIARWTGVVGGALLSISAVWWLPFYPVWALVYIAVGILVMYGLIVHGSSREMEQATA